MLIENGTVISLDESGTIYSPGWIRIESGAITEVSPRPIEPHPGEERIVAAGMIVMPGLINSHTHLFQTLIRGIFEDLPFDQWLSGIYHCGQVLSADDARISANLGSLEALRSGTTTVVEHHFLNGSDDIPEATIAGMRDIGVRTVFARTAMDLAALAPEEVLEAPDLAVSRAAALIDRYRSAQSTGAVTIMAGANTPGVSASREMSIAMAEFAEASGTRLSMHLSESRAVIARVRASTGVEGVVRWLNSIGALRGPALAAHSVHIDDEEIQLLAEHDVTIVHNPISNLFLGDGIAPIKKAVDAGVNVALGTDGASSNNSQNMFEVVKIAGLLQRGRLEDPNAMSALDALRMATTNAARALGLADLIGSVSVGKRADVIVVDALGTIGTVALHRPVSQVVHCAPSLNVVIAIVDGEVVLRDGVSTRVDVGELLANGQSAGVRMAQRLGV